MSPTRRALLAGACAGPLAVACASAGDSQAGGASTRWSEADAIVRSIKPPAIPARDLVPVREAGDPADDMRPAINRAIQTLSAAGGGRVLIPAGVTWLVDGPIHLKSRIGLHVSAGATLRFSGNHDAYLPPVFTRWEGTECWMRSPFVYARGQSDVAITGAGTIDGQGEANWLPWRPLQRADQTRLRDMGRDGVAVDTRVFGAEARLRPVFVQFVACERVLIEGVTLRDSPFWCVHPVYCTDVVVRGITIISRHINSDGVDPDSSRNVLIERCAFEVGDDGVALKAGRDQDGWRVGRVCENIVVRDCRYLGSTGGGMAIGSEMSGGVRRVFVDGYDIPRASHTLYYKANRDRGGFIEDVRIRNVRAGDVRALIKFSNDFHSYRGGDFPTRFRRITMENVTCDKAEVGLHISGDPRAPVEDILVRNLVAGTVTRPLQVAEARGVRLVNVRMNGARLTNAAPSARDTWLKLPN
jgi:polygalacturonase